MLQKMKMLKYRKNLIVPSTDFEIDCKSTEIVEKNIRNIKIERWTFIADSIPENKLHSIIDFNMEEDKPKKVMNTSEINRTDTDT